MNREKRQHCYLNPASAKLPRKMSGSTHFKFYK
jgi:hypothetical protein